MASNRIGRINEEVQRELAALIPTVKDPRVTGMISVTAVDVTQDLKFAKVYISVLEKEDSDQVLKGLKSAAGYLRRELGRALNLRHTPELTFVGDDSMAKGAKSAPTAIPSAVPPGCAGRCARSGRLPIYWKIRKPPSCLPPIWRGSPLRLATDRRRWSRWI